MSPSTNNRTIDCTNNKDQVLNLPVITTCVLFRLHKKDLEVIYYTESMDEYMMQHLTEFDDKKFQDASKDELKFGDKDDKVNISLSQF